MKVKMKYPLYHSRLTMTEGTTYMIFKSSLLRSYLIKSLQIKNLQTSQFRNSTIEALFY